ncbi:hypothetical protein [Psychroserpens sp.]|uniref:hypothetical protein n=1 Tax=Psychroserpens sp. TaxID=2020870 RepID=UPI002B27B68A|nr:hypothetical protein [Psychroserpens sp.]
MKTFKPILLLTLSVLFTLTSCRTEDDLAIDPPVEETIEANSTVADLLSRTASNDGSDDNIIDNASCLSVQLPVTVTVNGIELEINDDDGYEDIEDIIDLFDDDVDSVVISYPITIILVDFSTVVVNSDSELAALVVNCVGENEDDDDIECIDFQYPITASVLDENNNLINSITINSDNDMYDFIDDLDGFAAATINFPITVIFADGTTQVINTIQELENAIEMADDSCDEDDDNDFDDDDCDSCSTNDLDTIFADCTEWSVDKLERNDNDLEDNYVGYEFEFNSDGTILVTQGINTFNGTWEASGTGNTISVIINVIGLSDFNDTWNLHEIEQEPGEVKVDLRLGDDRLRFESDCSSNGSIDDTALVNALTNGDWYVTYYFDDTDETADFTDYTFNFASDNTATAMDMSGTTNGSWSTSSGDNTELGLNLNFGTGIPLDELADDWDVLEVTNDIIRLKDISGGDGSEDFLTFERTPFNGGINDTALVNALTNGDWYVTYYFDDTNETPDFADYTFNFASNNTATAMDMSGTTNGSWSTTSGDDTELGLNLNFGTGIPLDELADDWDVLEVTNDIIRLKDISGGDGSEDFLTFERTPFDGGNGNDDLEDILTDGLWIVASYTEDADDQTGNYSGYQLDFDPAGTVVADNGSNPNNGTWMVISSGNQMVLDFGIAIPFEEFNDDDWDVISVSATEVVIQDVSGGGGGTDTLTLQKL